MKAHGIGGQKILRVHCEPNEAKRPYAFVSRQRRWFSKRLDARVRSMSRTELAAAFAQPPVAGLREKALARLDALRDEAAQRKAKVFWIGLEAHADLGVDVLDPKVGDLCTHPDASRQRDDG